VNYLLIVAGGGAGSLARYLTGTAIMSRYGGRFPLGTLAVNVAGSFLIGLIMTVLTERRYLLVIGFLGGYTTFSSFEWETYASMREGGFWIGLANVALSVTLGYAAVWLGSALARR
jgi:CrcB protein